MGANTAFTINVSCRDCDEICESVFAVALHLEDAEAVRDRLRGEVVRVLGSNHGDMERCWAWESIGLPDLTEYADDFRVYVEEVPLYDA
jgi:hypothetical protein